MISIGDWWITPQASGRTASGPTNHWMSGPFDVLRTLVRIGYCREFRACLRDYGHGSSFGQSFPIFFAQPLCARLSVQYSSTLLELLEQDQHSEAFFSRTQISVSPER